MTILNIYESPVVVDRIRHATMRVAPVSGFGFAVGCQAVPLAAVEFIEVAREYPIVFARVQERLVALAVLGVRANENLFVTADGRWEGRYVPAFLRRYPFVVIEAPGGVLSLGLDEGCPAVGAADGELLFDHDGNNTAFLERTLSFVSQAQDSYNATQTLLATIEQLGVLVPMNARFAMKDGRHLEINDFLCVQEEKLLSIDAENLEKIYRTGILALMYAHLWSLGNFNRLLEKLA